MTLVRNAGRRQGLKRQYQTQTPDSTIQLQRFARERADEQARRVPWKRLAEAQKQYIDWQEFYLWVRSILEVEGDVPDWLADILNERCPGFLANQIQLTDRRQTKPLPLRLEDWIDEHVFGFAQAENWFAALTYYALRDARYQRAEVCWSESVARWNQKKPDHYPTLEEWKREAAQCDEDAHLLPEVKEARASRKLVSSERLTEAVTDFIEWEAFAYWVRPALEAGNPLPPKVAEALARRCPGLSEPRYPNGRHADQIVVPDWDRLMLWIIDNCFKDAKSEGWFDAILLEARRHPRAIRTVEYAEHCEERWSSQPPTPYPSFEDWRRDADAHVMVDAD